MQQTLGHSIPGTDLVLEQHIASTQMSTIYRVRSSHLGGRDFCAKFVPSAQRSHRWQREIQVLSRLRNPHIVKLFRTIELDDDIVLVLDWVPGVNLGAYVSEHGPLSPTETLRVTRQLILALIDVHALGIVHRDLKPANIMIDRLPSGDLFACLLDFGISKPVADGHVSTGFVGSPLYAAPEQIAERPVDERTDLYQLGCLLHFMLTGAPPFNAADAPTVMNAHLYQTPSRVSSSVPWLRRWGLDDLVLQMLAKSPDNRLQSAEQVLQRIEEAGHSHAGETLANAVETLATEEPASHGETLSAVGPDRSVVTADQSHIVVRKNDVESHFEIPGATVTGLHMGSGVVYFGTSTGTIHRLTVSSAIVEDILQLPRTRPIRALAHTTSHLIAADDDGRVFRINPADGSYHVVRSPGSPPIALSGADGTHHFAVVDDDGMLTIFEGLQQRVRAQLGMSVRHLAMSPDGYVVGAFGDGQTLVVSAIDGSLIHRVGVKRRLDAITFIGATLIGIGQTNDGAETFEILS